MRSLLKWSVLLRTRRWRWMMYWANLSDLSLGPLPWLMDRRGEPTYHHLPRSTKRIWQRQTWFHSRVCELLTVMVQRIRGDQKTFVEVAGSMISVVQWSHDYGVCNTVRIFLCCQTRKRWLEPATSLCRKFKPHKSAELPLSVGHRWVEEERNISIKWMSVEPALAVISLDRKL